MSIIDLDNYNRFWVRRVFLKSKSLNVFLFIYIIFKIIKMKFKILLLVTSVSIFSCKKDDSSSLSLIPKCESSFIDQSAKGKIFGKNLSVYTSKFSEDVFDSTEFSITFYKEKSDTGIIVKCPKKVGKYNFGSGRSANFTRFNHSTVSNCGAVEVLSINETTLTGKIDIQYDTDNNFNGNFTAVAK